MANYNYEKQTNYIGSDGLDLGKKLMSQDYFFDFYPDLAAEIYNVQSNLWVWGNNSSTHSNLGLFTDYTNKTTPVTTFAGGTDWKQVSAGQYHMAAIKTDGTLWTWGNNTQGQLGTNDVIIKRTPVTTFAGGTNWKQVIAGFDSTAAVKTDGTLWVWGFNNYGQLGINNTLNRSTPVTTFAGGTNWKQVSAGQYHTSAIKTDGTLWVWGYNPYGNLGTNDTTNRLIPVTTFAGGTNWKQVSASLYNVSAIKTDGTLWVWGYNPYGNLGTNDIINRSTPVTTFAGGTDWKQVSCGQYNTVAIKTDGTLWGWGFGNFGQLGTNDAIGKSTPVTTFAGGTNWKQVSAGQYHVSAIKTDGTLWVWGYNPYGNLGTNDIINRSTPVTTFAGGTNWKQVSSAANYFVSALELQDISYTVES